MTEASNEVSPVVALETIRTLDRKALVGTALTVATTVPALLVVIIMFCAFFGGVAIAVPWLVAGVLGIGALGAITTRNLKLSSARKAAIAALESSSATASLSDDALEIHGGKKTWRFALGGSSRSLRMLPAAKVLRRED